MAVRANNFGGNDSLSKSAAHQMSRRNWGNLLFTSLSSTLPLHSLPPSSLLLWFSYTLPLPVLPSAIIASSVFYEPLGRRYFYWLYSLGTFTFKYIFSSQFSSQGSIACHTKYENLLTIQLNHWPKANIKQGRRVLTNSSDCSRHQFPPQLFQMRDIPQLMGVWNPSDEGVEWEWTHSSFFALTFAITIIIIITNINIYKHYHFHFIITIHHHYLPPTHILVM